MATKEGRVIWQGEGLKFTGVVPSGASDNGNTYNSGVSNPRTFTRVRRCVMVDNLRIY